jgi:hypothetical protein
MNQGIQWSLCAQYHMIGILLCGHWEQANPLQNILAYYRQNWRVTLIYGSSERAPFVF